MNGWNIDNTESYRCLVLGVRFVSFAVSYPLILCCTFIWLLSLLVAQMLHSLHKKEQILLCGLV